MPRPTVLCRTSLSWVSSLVATSLILGCAGNHSFAYDGSWLGHRQLTPKPGTDPHVADEVSRLVVTFKDDGTFEMFDAGIKKDGHFEVHGDHAVLYVDTILDQPMARQSADIQKRNVPITVTPIDQGDVKFFDPTGFDRNGLILHRMPKPLN